MNSEEGQVPEVIQAKAFQVVDDDGNLRAELGFRVARYNDHVDNEPTLEFRDAEGYVLLSVGLNYFDRPRLFMGDNGSVVGDETADGLRIWDARQQIEVSEGRLVVRDAEGVIRLQVGLGSGDEGDSPRLLMRDRAGRTRLEIELVEVEGERMVSKVDDDYELSPLVWSDLPRLKMRDEEGNIRLEVGYNDDMSWVVMR